MADKKITFRVRPEAADAAIQTLAMYVSERAALLNPEAKIKITTVNDAIKMMDALYKFKEKMQKDVKTPVEQAYTNLQRTVVPRLMDEAGNPKISVAGVGAVRLQDDVETRVLDMEALKAWLIEHELEDLIKPTVNSSTLAAQVRQRLKEDQELPSEEILKVTPYVKAIITRAGVKEAEM